MHTVILWINYTGLNLDEGIEIDFQITYDWSVYHEETNELQFYYKLSI